MFKEQLEAALNKINESHQYLRRTSKSSERNLERAKERAARSSGNLGYTRSNDARNALLKQIEKQRPLRRHEFIQLYGYQAWVDYVTKYGLPETHKWADAHEKT